MKSTKRATPSKNPDAKPAKNAGKVPGKAAAEPKAVAVLKRFLDASLK